MEDTNKDMNIDKEEAKKVKKVKKEKKARKRGRKGRIVAQIFVCFLLTVAFVASAAGGAVAAYYKAATNTITTDTKTALKLSLIHILKSLVLKVEIRFSLSQIKKNRQLFMQDSFVMN